MPIPSYSNWDKNLLGLLDKFDEQKLENNSIFSIWYGFSNNNNSLLMSNNKFATSFNLAIEYGFLRIKDDKTTKPYYLHFGERIYFENQSSHLKPKSWTINGQTLDGWIFGLKAIDGVGKKLSKFDFEFQHSSSLIWTRFDFENYYRNVLINPQIQKIDERYKFGRNYDIAFALKFVDKFQLGLNFSKNFIFPEFEFKKWVISYITEIGLQRWMDFVDEKLRGQTNEHYWCYKYIYKTIITALITTMMKEKPYLFFNTDKAFHNNGILIKVSYIGF